MGKGLLIAVVCVGMVVALFASLVYACQPTFNKDDYIIESYYIEKGDTLYGLACKYSATGDDPREWVKAVEELNHCTALIYAGDTIEIYTPKG